MCSLFPSLEYFRVWGIRFWDAVQADNPALAERLARVMGETSGRSTERRVFVGGMPFSYEVCSCGTRNRCLVCKAVNGREGCSKEKLWDAS